MRDNYDQLEKQFDGPSVERRQASIRRSKPELGFRLYCAVCAASSLSESGYVTDDKPTKKETMQIPLPGQTSVTTLR